MKIRFRFDSRRMALLALVSTALVSPWVLSAQTAVQTAVPAKRASEERASRNLEGARENPLALRNLLVNLPKGGDLHNHLAGAVYAESWIRAGGEDDLCVDLATLSFVKTQTMTRSNPPQPVCGEGKVAAATAQQNQKLYTALVNAFSIRSFVPSSGVSAHDHFFDAFQRFFGTDPRHTGEWLNEVATRAAAQNEQYLELMETPSFDHTAAIAKELGWNENLAQFRDALLARGLRDDIGPARVHFDQAEANRRKMEHCGEPTATAACQVTIRFLYQVLRGFPKEQVFAQTLLGFEVASADPLVVGINFVMPEDAYIPMRDYAEQMKMVAFLHSLYPKVHISLHAGELAPGLVPPEGLCCHIRMAVEVAHAERIGHGVDLMYEDKPHQLLREMAAKHVMVEINLTSNDWILGIKGKHHPLPIYRQFQVPVALSTDDEGVSRIDVTHEYQRAVEDFALRYADLKRMARTSIEHSFLPGRSLWAEADQFGKTASECASDTPGAKNPSSGCALFLKSSEKAAEQWELERRYLEFESQF